MSPGIREGTGNGSCGIPVRLKMRLQALCLCAILGLPSIVVTLTLFVITQLTSTSKSIQPSEVTITTSRLSETEKNGIIDPHNFDYQFGSLDNGTIISNISTTISFDVTNNGTDPDELYDGEKTNLDINSESRLQDFPCYENFTVYYPIYLKVQFWVEGVLLIIVGILGIFGNLLTLLVLNRSKGTNFNQLLGFLSIIDMLLIICFILMSACTTVMENQPGWFKLLFPYVLWPLGNISITASVLLVVFVSVERYLAICRPLQYKPGSIFYILLVCVISLAVNVGRFLEFQVIYVPETDANGGYENESDSALISTLKNNLTSLRQSKHDISTQLTPLLHVNASDQKHALDHKTQINVFSNDLNHTPQSFEVVKDITSQNAYNVSHNTKIEWAPTELMGDERYIMFSRYWTETIVIGLLPLLALIILNHGIYVKIRKSAKFRKMNEGTNGTLNYCSKFGGTVKSPDFGRGMSMKNPIRMDPKKKEDDNSLLSKAKDENDVNLNNAYQMSEMKSKSLYVKNNTNKQDRNDSPKFIKKYKSKHVQTKRRKGNDKRLIDDKEGEKVLNNQYLSTKADASSQVTRIRITPSSPELRKSIKKQNSLATYTMTKSNPTSPTTRRSASVEVGDGIRSHYHCNKPPNLGLERKMSCSAGQLQQTRKPTQKSGGSGERSTKLLVGIVVVFLVCHVSRLVIQIEAIIHPSTVGDAHAEYCTERDQLNSPFYVWILTSFNNFFLVLNSSINFVVYCFVGRRFRNTLISFFRKSPSTGKCNNAMVPQDQLTQTRINPSSEGLSMDLYPGASPRFSSANTSSRAAPLPQIMEDLKGYDENNSTRKCIMVNKEDLVASLSTSDKNLTHKSKTTYI